MSRASSSIDRFRCAARSRNFRFTVSSRLRIVMLAIRIIAINFITAACNRNQDARGPAGTGDAAIGVP
jgi:hypothetical protein